MGRKRLPPRLWKRDDKPYWHACFWAGGKRQRVSLGTADEEIATARLAKLVANPAELTRRNAYARALNGPVVYFVQAGIGGNIKIGKADKLEVRLRSLQTAHHEKLIVLGVIVGTGEIEKHMHALFHAERLEGEWFRASLELLKFISMNTVRPR